MEELYDRADIVAEVTVVNHVNHTLIATLPTTTSRVEVEEVYKGDLTKNDVIQVNELGAFIVRIYSEIPINHSKKKK